MKKLYLVILSMVLLSGSSHINKVYSQKWLINPQLKNTDSTQLNFYDIQDAFYSWALLKRTTKIRGTKRFKRWEWYYEDKVYPGGKMPDPLINFYEWDKSKSSIFNIRNTLNGSNAAWVSISPNEIPPPSDGISMSGMGRINCIEFHPSNQNTIWIGASQGGVWKTVDGGINWICLTDNLPVNRISDIAVDPINPEIIYIATGDIEYFGLDVLSNAFSTIYGLGVFKTTDGGINWFPTGHSFSLQEGDYSLISDIIINPANHEEIIVAGISGLFKSYDSGTTWNQVYNDMIIDMDKNPLRDSTLFATGLFIPGIGGVNRILKSIDFGTTWDTLNTPVIPSQSEILRSELEISKSDTSIIYILSCGINEGLNALFKSEDSGYSWFTVAARDPGNYPGSVLAPNIFGWSDGGYFNNPLIPPDEGGQGTYDITLIINPDDPNKIYTGGINMWGSEDGGVTWDIVSFWMNFLGESIHADQHSSAYNPLNNNYYQTNDGGIYKTNSIITGNTDTILNCIDIFTMEIIPGCYELPTVWEDISAGLHISEYYRISTCLTYPGIVVGGTQDNGSFMLKNGLWQKIYGGDGMESMIHHFNPDIIYVTNQYGVLNKSTNGGLTFTSGLESDITDSGETGHWVTPYKMHPQDPQILYAGFKNIWKSTNGGTSWSKISSFANNSSSSINALAIAPSNPDYIYAARRGSLYRTKTGGSQAWEFIHIGLPTNLAVITSICIADNDPENIWVSFNGYVDGEKVYHSTNAGETWENISGGLPNVGANILEFQFGTIDGVSHALYLGTDIGIYYTNDSIQQSPDKWSLYSEGLPHVIVTDLEIQYGSQKLYAATYGRGLWETNLFSPSVIEGIEYVSEPEFYVHVFPNPTTDIINIKVSDPVNQNVSFDMYNLNGSKIRNIYLSENTTYSYSLNLSHLKTGTYILRISIENSDFTYKIIKTN